MTHKNVSAIYAFMMSVLILMLTTAALPVWTSILAKGGGIQTISSAEAASQSPTSSMNSTCLDRIQADMDAKAEKVDQTKAKLLADSNSTFMSEIKGYTTKFNSVFNEWTYDPTSCTAAMTSVNVAYDVYNGTQIAKSVVVTEDSGVSKALKVTAHKDIIVNTVPITQTANWSGYQLWGTSTERTTPVYQATASWSVPDVAEPYTGACFFHNCDFSIWPGITGYNGGTNGIVQAGTDSHDWCSVGCFPSYYAWYEFYPQNTVQCSMTVEPSDSITTTITNRAKPGLGGDVNHWDVTVYNNSRFTSCGVSNYYFSNFGTPYYADFIAERPYDSADGYDTRLPYFSTTTVTGSMYYGGSSTGIWTPFNNGWGEGSEMWNDSPLTKNINLSGVNTGSSFTETYVNSDGT
jgi:hypothetical protein